jgi:enolase
MIGTVGKTVIRENWGWQLVGDDLFVTNWNVCSGIANLF